VPKRIGVLVVLLVMVFASAAWAADVTGKWDVTLTTPSFEAHGKASFTQEGDRVTGWLGPEGDPFPITGAVNGNKLVIETHPQEGRMVAFAKAELTINANKMSGTMDTDKGKIELVRSK
jgi:hypothetical protein